MLEYIVHVDPHLLPLDLVSVKAIVPEPILPKRVDASSLPSNWRAYPAPEALADIGDAWQNSRESLLLSVPSAVIPEENNVLVNPDHPDFARLRVDAVKPFAFDGPLFGGTR